MSNSIIICNQDEIQNRIFTIRGRQVMLDSHLAELFGVELKRLNEQVKRNNLRFPPEFMFHLTVGEIELLRSHFATLKNATPYRSAETQMVPGSDPGCGGPVR